jgi:hypothetical protein
MTDITLSTDYLAAGALIEARIRARVPVKRVEELATLYDMLDSDSLDALTSGLLPAAFVGYDGDQPGDVTEDGRMQVVGQRWLVVLVVANARNADTGRGVARAAGPLLLDLVRALTGWQPEGFSELIRQVPPRPGYRAGVGFYPLTFFTAAVVEGLNED